MHCYKGHPSNCHRFLLPPKKITWTRLVLLKAMIAEWQKWIPHGSAFLPSDRSQKLWIDHGNEEPWWQSLAAREWPSERLPGWWFQPSWKNMSQNENLPQIGVKIKNIWNHHLVTLLGINISHQIYHFWVDDFPFPKVGHVRSLEGKYNHNGTIISEWKTSYFSSMRNLIPCHTPPHQLTYSHQGGWENEAVSCSCCVGEKDLLVS